MKINKRVKRRIRDPIKKMKELGVKKRDIIELIDTAYSCPGPLFLSRARLERELSNFHIVENPRRVFYKGISKDSTESRSPEFIRKTLYQSVLDHYYSG